MINLGNRSAGIVFRNNCILLMFRKKNGKVYYVFPGGSIDTNESREAAAIRELFEETSIIVNSARLLYHLRIKDIPTDNKNIFGFKDEFLFLCEYVSGNPSLTEEAEESERSSEKNIYKPLWVPIDQINNILLYPLEIRDVLFQDFKNGFKSNELKIEVNNSNLRHA